MWLSVVVCFSILVCLCLCVCLRLYMSVCLWLCVLVVCVFVSVSISVSVYVYPHVCVILNVFVMHIGDWRRLVNYVSFSLLPRSQSNREGRPESKKLQGLSITLEYNQSAKNADMKFSNYWSGVLYNIRCCWSNATKVEYSLLSEANFLGVCWKHVQKRICSFRVSWQGSCQYTDGGVVWRRNTWGGDCKGVDFDLSQVWSIARLPGE